MLRESLFIPLGVDAPLVWKPVRKLRSGGATRGPIIIIGFTIFAAIVLLAAPSEWRSRKVQHAHIARIAAYSWAPGIATYLVASLVFTWMYIEEAIMIMIDAKHKWFVLFNSWISPPSWLEPFTEPTTHFAMAAAYAIWLPLHWGFSLFRNIKFANPWLLLGFVTVAGWLGMLISLAMIGDLRRLF